MTDHHSQSDSGAHHHANQNEQDSLQEHLTQADPSDEQLRSLWEHAAANEAIATAVRTIYDDVAQQVAQRGPACWASGRCCNFEAFGHRLYVTGLEAALAQRWVDQPATTESVRTALTRGGCPFQIGNLCNARDARPLGCRVFFCDKSSIQWQHELLEQCMVKIRTLHDQHNIPYRYAEWRALLDQLSDSAQ